MCDTFVALKNSTKDNSIIFAKNSDREPEEPHIGVYVNRKKHDEKKVKCTYIEIDQVPETYACMLFKPHWIWGAEMGVNEYGVVIGNEAIFTKAISKRPSLIGMDYVRLSLERSRNAEEAVTVIISLLKKYGQGGNCAYSKRLYYDNSYLIADFNEAYILETAGNNWVLKKVEDIYSISNSITIRSDYIKSSLNEKIDFKKKFEKKLIAKIASGDFRRNITLNELKKRKGEIDVIDMLKITRIHNKSKNFFNGSLKNICMHSKSLISSETTGSLIVKLKEGNIYIYATLSPRPCSSIYKPITFDNKNILFDENDVEKAVKYWKNRKILALRIGMDENLKKIFMIKRDLIESELISMEWNKENISNIWKEEENTVYDLLINHELEKYKMP